MTATQWFYFPFSTKATIHYFLKKNPKKTKTKKSNQKQSKQETLNVLPCNEGHFLFKIQL